MEYTPETMVPPLSVSATYEAMKAWHPERRRHVAREWAMDGFGDIVRTVAYRFDQDGDKDVARELSRIANEHGI